jgi:hypothetical protein
MPRRQKPSLIELLVIVSILGILAAIVIPAMEQARQRPPSSGERVGQAHDVAGGPEGFDGQLNTIEVPELSQGRDGGSPGRAIGVLIGLVPVILPVVVVLIIFGRVRRQLSGGG